MNPRRTTIAATVAAGMMALAGCQDSGAPYLATEGGGFLFNYRLAEAYAQIVVGPPPKKTLPEGATIEVSFEDPAGGAPVVMQHEVTNPGQLRYSFQTRPLQGIKADKPYAVTVRLIASDGGEMEKLDKTFVSNVDQSVLPKVAPVIGPGYARNPAAAGQ